MDAFEQDGATCRTAKVANYTGANHAVTQLKFCKSGDKWQMTEADDRVEP